MSGQLLPEGHRLFIWTDDRIVRVSGIFEEVDEMNAFCIRHEDAGLIDVNDVGHWVADAKPLLNKKTPAPAEPRECRPGFSNWWFRLFTLCSGKVHAVWAIQPLGEFEQSHFYKKNELILMGELTNGLGIFCPRYAGSRIPDYMQKERVCRT